MPGRILSSGAVAMGLQLLVRALTSSGFSLSQKSEGILSFGSVCHPCRAVASDTPSKMRGELVRTPSLPSLKSDSQKPAHSSWTTRPQQTDSLHNLHLAYHR